MDENWIGFAFCVAFEINNHPTIHGTSHHSFSSSLPHHFYLSFESEHTEERFDMPLHLELNKIDSSKHLWVIYISRQHCHFVKTGAHITFKAYPGLTVKNWGLRMLIKDTNVNGRGWSLNYRIICSLLPKFDARCLVFDYAEESSTNYGPKIQLPYNWLVAEEDEVENLEAKSKENGLSNLGL
ncbi:disease resistance protein [Sesbania bispinosa]|nr:disease resistance protein [Sesbania bispinosa]